MFHHPDFALADAHDRRRELVARADRFRLSAAIRRRNRVPAVPRGRPETTAPGGIRVAAPATW